jgi:hypothetical protein
MPPVRSCYVHAHKAAEWRACWQQLPQLIMNVWSPASWQKIQRGIFAVAGVQPSFIRRDRGLYRSPRSLGFFAGRDRSSLRRTLFMTDILSTISRGKRPQRIFALIYGTDGVGKSFWASNAPKPIFVGTEQLDVARFPQTEEHLRFSWSLTVARARLPAS